MPFRSDAQRKAVMAKLRGGSGASGGRFRGAGASGSWTEKSSLERLGDKIVGTRADGSRLSPGEVFDQFLSGPSRLVGRNTRSGDSPGRLLLQGAMNGLEDALLAAPLLLTGGAAAPAAAAAKESARKVLAAALAKAVAGFGGAAVVDSVRDANDFSERNDHDLALLQRALEVLGSYGVLRAGQSLAGDAVTAIKKALRMAKYKKIALEGAELQAASSSASRDMIQAELDSIERWEPLKKLLGSVKSGAKTYLGPAYDEYTQLAGYTGADISAGLATSAGRLSASLAAGVHKTEQAEVARHEQDAYEAFSRGESYVIPGTEDVFDSPGKLLGMGAVGTLGNPIEKLTRYYNDGSWTMPLAARGAVRAMERVVAEKLAAGEMSPADATEAQAEVSDRLPRNMAGRSIDLITAAGASFTRWKASEARERIQMDDYTARVGSVLDGDTLTVPDGKGGEKSVRFSDSNAPEIAHPEHGKAAAEFWGAESKAALAKLVPAGTPIKVLRDPEQLTEKYGRDLGNVEIPANFIQRAIWSVSPALDPFKGRDVGQVMIEQGATQPGQYRMLAENDPFRKFDYDQAAGRAQASGVGMFGPERETTDLTKVKPFKVPEYAKKEKTALERISTAAGSSLMYTGRTGLLPGGAAVTWNAALAALGAAQHAEGGVRYSDSIEFKMPRAVKKSGTGSGSVADTREAGEPPAALAGFGASLKALRR